MSQLEAIEIKAFVPARDLALSLRFYADLGFTVAWHNDTMAGPASTMPAFCCSAST